MKFRAAVLVVRSIPRGPPLGCPDEGDEERGGSRHVRSLGRAFLSPTSDACCLRVGCLRAEPLIPRRPRCLHRSSRPLPRRPVTSAASLARRTFHRRELFPRRHRSDAASNRDLRHDRGTGALPETAVSCATHRFVTGDSPTMRFRASSAAGRDPRSRRHGKPELPARASLDLAVAGPPRSAAAWCRLGSSTSATIQFST